MNQQRKNTDNTLTDGQRSEKDSGTTETAVVQQHTNKWTTLLVVAIGVFMATLDSSIVNISLPAIARDFGVPLSGAIEWVIIAYLVVTAAVLLTAGRLADMVGRKIVWLIGLVVFTGSSVLCGFATSLAFLIAARALQGLGGALLLAVSPAMLTAAFPSNERGRALGLNAINVALGVSVGPILGGFITGYFTWRWIFFVNVPFGILGLIATVIFIKEKVTRSPGRFDPLGAALLAIGLACITAGLSFAQELGWGSPTILILLIVGVIALIILPFVELRVPNPAIVLSLLKSRVFSSALLSLVISFLALFAVSFMLPFYLEELRGFSSELSGFLLTPLPLTLAFIAPISGMLADRYGTRWLAVGGMAIACVGLISISFLNEQSSIWDIVWRLLLTGVGQSLFQSPNNSALLGAAPREHQGSASGFLATARTIGQSLSIALAGAIFTGLGGATAGLMLVSGKAGAQTAQLQQTFVQSFHLTFVVCAAIAAVGVLASLTRGKETRKTA
ncbi:MFS transporter [Dictyobacter alpinus]|uniref:MFS transporter n=1 Tax=Dictyobacter alpinus TaxID=2014873 RepID=A0A402B4S3_9CHLR|nr:MFS transporter [Dictyobacter alpinus]GCE26353.1 MFS transporter [Dictyobacter alpinus]